MKSLPWDICMNCKYWPKCDDVDDKDCPAKVILREES